MHYVAFISPLGGTGQTTLVANVATALSRRGNPCLAVDLAAQNTLGLHLGLLQPAINGWASAAAAGRWVGEVGLENSETVGYLPFGAATVEELEAIDRLLKQPLWLQNQLSELQLDPQALVLLDAPTWPAALSRQALQCADMVLACLSASVGACKVQQLVQSIFDQAPATADKAVVITDFDPRRKLQLDALQTLRGQWSEYLVPYAVHRDENQPAALTQASCVCTLTPHAQSAHDMQGIASLIAKRCGIETGASS